MRPGVRLGVDVGKARIGLAKSDATGTLAVPLATIRARAEPIFETLKFIGAHDVMEIIIGLPVNLKREHTGSTAMAQKFAQELSNMTTIPVRVLDERLSTVTAQAQLHEAGRNTRRSRSVIDQQAAVIILQNALDYERTTGELPGQIVKASEGWL